MISFKVSVSPVLIWRWGLTTNLRPPSTFQPPTYKCTHTHTHTHTRARARAHTHTHTQAHDGKSEAELGVHLWSAGPSRFEPSRCCAPSLVIVLVEDDKVNSCKAIARALFRRRRIMTSNFRTYCYYRYRGMPLALLRLLPKKRFLDHRRARSRGTFMRAPSTKLSYESRRGIEYIKWMRKRTQTISFK